MATLDFRSVGITSFRRSEVEHSPKQTADVWEHSRIQDATPISVDSRGLYEPSLTITAVPSAIA